MGAVFKLEHANIVAYLTGAYTISKTGPFTTFSPFPRELASDFLWSIGYPDKTRLFSEDQQWIDFIEQEARRAFTDLGNYRSQKPQSNEKDEGYQPEQLLPYDFVATLLAGLRSSFSRYPLFCLAVGSNSHFERFDALIKYMALASGRNCLFLIPENLDADKPSLEMLAPFPNIAKIFNEPEKWPGILIWSRNGVTAFIPFRDMERVFQLLHMSDDFDLHRAEQVIIDHQSPRQAKRLLHLSDLHMGPRHVARNTDYVLGRVTKVVQDSDIDRIVITGDLFDNPLFWPALRFKDFNNQLLRLTGKRPIVIPGNHDQHLLGSIGELLRHVADIRWENIVVDDEMKCVFYCFDSARERAFLARGRVSSDQRRDVAADFQNQSIARPIVNDYLPIALVHHHLYEHQPNTEGALHKALGIIESLHNLTVRMENADEFLKWCARRRIPLVLHGHKHIQRLSRENVSIGNLEQPQYFEVTAVGCGATLGVGGKPMSYNILSWNSETHRWGVTFWADPGDGSGFECWFASTNTSSSDSV